MGDSHRGKANRDAADAALAAVRRVLAAEAHLRWGYVFGSLARGETFRDVDVALMPSAGMPDGAVAWGQIVARLQDAVGRPVDLVDLARPVLPFVGPMLTERVVVLDREPDARLGWEVEVTRRWLDFQPAYDAAERVRRTAMRDRLRRAQ